MSEIDDKFQRAYQAVVVDEAPEKAVPLCREILTENPEHHMARMLLANTLDDLQQPEGIAESRTLYLDAIARLGSFDPAWAAWNEEDPIRNLAMWEDRNGRPEFAATLWVLDHIISGRLEPKADLLEFLKERDPQFAESVELILSKWRRTRPST